MTDSESSRRQAVAGIVHRVSMTRRTLLTAITRITQLERQVHHLMATLDDLKAAISDLDAKVTDATNRVDAAVAHTVTPDYQPLVAAVQAETARVEAIATAHESGVQVAGAPSPSVPLVSNGPSVTGGIPPVPDPAATGVTNAAGGGVAPTADPGAQGAPNVSGPSGSDRATGTGSEQGTAPAGAPVNTTPAQPPSTPVAAPDVPAENPSGVASGAGSTGTGTSTTP